MKKIYAKKNCQIDDKVLTSTGSTIEMLDQLCILLGDPNTVSMVPLLTIITSTVRT